MSNIVTKNINDLNDLAKFAKQLTSGLSAPCVVFLRGDLGAGKTTFVKKLLEKLKYAGLVKSPTYTFVETYNLPSFNVHHFDLYRLADPDELEFLGFSDYINENSVLFIEWPEKAISYLPQADLEITFEIAGDSRALEIKCNTQQGEQALKCLQ